MAGTGQQAEGGRADACLDPFLDPAIQQGACLPAALCSPQCQVLQACGQLRCVQCAPVACPGKRQQAAARHRK
jgi:hypothetical protein